MTPGLVDLEIRMSLCDPVLIEALAHLTLFQTMRISKIRFSNEIDKIQFIYIVNCKILL